MNTFSIPSEWISKPLNVLVIGAGGTGSAFLSECFQLDYLLRKVTNHQVHLNISVYDDDKVSESNVGRQGFYPVDVGMYKAETLVSRFNLHGNLSWKYKNERLLPEVFDYRNYDLVVTCVDKAKIRADLGRFFANDNRGSRYNKSLMWLDLGNGRASGQIILGHAYEQINKLPNVFDLYPQLESIVDVDEDSCSHIEALRKQEYGINKKVVLEATRLLWELLRKGSISHHGSYVDLESATVKPLKIDPVCWQVLGYNS
ncbi:PRTRC system ThiF family protein [Pseudoalteromonas shioyasakiensis]|uniref:PRTRC system ThiF family protein n=1 Tax=Pseudoalteromonas shioyasakiensis TaxID=1190813 RepID=UPI001EFD96DC|nr:PRTRC system ThiF family protein [Pseudoalteromonas shioyasakiensis]MCG9733382.1 PRTRC system ThiF family protein [Pseudoalteromonas shioyasakiensis]